MANRNVILLPAIIGAIIIGILGIVFVPEGIQNKQHSFPIGTIKINDKIITTEIADSSENRRIWLKFRDDIISYNSSMILVYDKSDLHSISTLNIQFNLDLLWFNEDGDLVYMKENVSPCDFQFDINACTFKSTKPSKYIIASTSGFIKYHDIKDNASLTIISI